MAPNHPKTRHCMIAFILAIFVIACIIAIVYMVGFHPGQPAPST
jgi:hypothetical protein